MGVIRPKIRVKNEISRFLKFLAFEYFPFGPFGSDPGFEQLLRAYFRSKWAKREVYELDPPLFGTSAENPGAHDLSLYHVSDLPVSLSALVSSNSQWL